MDHIAPILMTITNIASIYPLIRYYNTNDTIGLTITFITMITGIIMDLSRNKNQLTEIGKLFALKEYKLLEQINMIAGCMFMAYGIFICALNNKWVDLLPLAGSVCIIVLIHGRVNDTVDMACMMAFNIMVNFVFGSVI